jgi:2'-5' RNA ligase
MALRCFISINLPETIRRSLKEVIDDLRDINADIRWVAADNIHLTLKFLGSTDATIIDAMREHLQKKLASYNRFYIKIAGVGCFPSARRPRVIWAGVEYSDILSELRADIDAVISGFGFAPDNRPFSPHLTLGRVQSMKGVPEVMRRCSALTEKDFGTVSATGVHIMKSELRPAGAVYSSLAEISFAPGRNNVH